MGEIIRTKADGENMILHVLLSEDEARQLKNHVTKIHVFSSDLCSHDAGIIERGNKGGTKYFSIPLSLKSRQKKKYSKVSYQKIEKDGRSYFVYVVEKDPLS